MIPCLDVRDGRVVKGVRFRDHRDVGDIVELASRYADQEADELVIYDITASPEQRTVDRQWIDRVAAVLDIPFCVAGGIRSIADAEDVLNKGADKISINSPALQQPELINDLATRFGQQCVVVGIDSMATNDGYRVHALTGSAATSHGAGRDTLSWAREVQMRGAGEIVLNCMNRDGVRRGYDVAQLAAVRQVCEVPLVASGGAGKISHFADVFKTADVDAALAASVFHNEDIDLRELKTDLIAQDIHLRPPRTH